MIAPDWAENQDHKKLGDGRAQLSFTMPGPFRTPRAIDWYSQHLASEGWIRLSEQQEQGLDSWVDYIDTTGERVDVWMSHWRNEDSSRSLRLILLHKNGSTEQLVTPVDSDFSLMPPD